MESGLLGAGAAALGFSCGGPPGEGSWRSGGRSPRGEDVVGWWGLLGGDGAAAHDAYDTAVTASELVSRAPNGQAGWEPGATERLPRRRLGGDPQQSSARPEILVSPTPESVCPFRCVDHPQPGPGFPQGHSPPGTRVDLETPSEHADTPRLPRGRGKNPNVRPRPEPGHLAASGPSTCLLCWAVSRRSLLSGKRPS